MLIGDLKIVNDIAEKKMKLMEKFKNILTGVEEQRKMLLHCVEDTCKLYPDFGRTTLAKKSKLKLGDILNWSSNLKLLTCFERCRLDMFKIAQKSILKFSKIGLILKKLVKIYLKIEKMIKKWSCVSVLASGHTQLGYLTLINNPQPLQK